MCHTVVQACASYSESTAGKCHSCASGYVYTSSNTCVAETPNCESHNDIGYCSACMEKHTLQHNKCHKTVADCEE